jgi:Tol biopolymer transport system component
MLARDNTMRGWEQSQEGQNLSFLSISNRRFRAAVWQTDLDTTQKKIKGSFSSVADKPKRDSDGDTILLTVDDSQQ